MIGKLIAFLFGSIVGSFLNVCIYRMPKKVSVVFPMSHCPKCKHNILWFDNIPLLSYIILRGKCRHCTARISVRYFLVELLTAVLFVLLYAGFGLQAKFFVYCVFACLLIIATFVDFEIQEIPDEISIGGTILALVLAFAAPATFDTISRFGALYKSFIGALAGAGLIYIIGLLGSFMFKKEAMGGGDVKLMAMIGAFLGLKLTIFTFFVAPFLGILPGIILKYRKGADTIPYGPYLSLAAIIAIFFGSRILYTLYGGIF